MSATRLEICNSAIGKVRGKRILSLDDNTTEARILTDLYPRIRDSLLRSHPWNFAKRRAALEKLSTSPAWGYSNQFQLPADLARILKTDIATGENWEKEGSLILTDATTVNIQYIANVGEEEYDACYCEVLAFKLAEQLAYPLTQGVSLGQAMAAGATQILKESRSFNAQEHGSIEQFEGSEWLNSRF